MTFIVVLVGWIFSLCLHEFSHALVAYYGGDTTVREKGYLTFNPLKYTHPVYSLLLPMLFLLLGGIGLPGGAVYIENASGSCAPCARCSRRSKEDRPIAGRPSCARSARLSRSSVWPASRPRSASWATRSWSGG